MVKNNKAFAKSLHYYFGGFGFVFIYLSHPGTVEVDAAIFEKAKNASWNETKLTQELMFVLLCFQILETKLTQLESYCI